MISGTMSPAADLFRMLLLLTAAAAFAFGGRNEKAVAVLYLCAAVLTFAGRRWTGFGYVGFERIVAATDVVLFILLCALALKVRAWWLTASAALQLITCLGHLAKLIDPTLPAIGYFMMDVASSYPSLILLAIGVWHHRRSGRDPSSAGSSRRAIPRRRS